MSTQKKNYIQQLAAAIFTNDEDPAIRALYDEHPLSFIKPVESWFILLRKMYNSVNKDLGKTGAGLKSIEELDADPRTKNLVDFASEALEFFSGAPQDEGDAAAEPDLDEDNDLEPGEIFDQPLVQQTNTNRPPDISFDSPPNSPPRHAKEDDFFTDMEGQPESSCDKGIEDVMKSLTVHSCKASGSALHGRSPATATHRSAGPSPSESTFCSASESHKRTRDVGAEVTKKLADASDSLLLHMQNKSESKVSSKRMKFEYARFSKELQAREAHAEREHNAHRFIATQSHERAMSEDKTRQLELELRLEEAKYRRLAMERINQVDTIGDKAN
ncbi:hypothetical protein BDR05DRAFT_945651 [Suillus weaverae]|nr:hypothetical protein BDR05DRAFT_945651 [Suillus weaverae]